MERISADEKETYMLVLVGVVRPYFATNKAYNETMREYYLLKAKAELPDLEWEIKIMRQEKTEVTASRKQ
jgi:hypothetical protein